MSTYSATNFLEHHQRSLENGLLTFGTDSDGDSAGLCETEFQGQRLENNEIFGMFIPNDSELEKLKRKGLNTNGWGSDDGDGLFGEYTPLRQNIILLCAAINGEL